MNPDQSDQASHWDEEGSGFSYLGIAMFTGIEAPTSAADQTMCATYFFSMDVAD